MQQGEVSGPGMSEPVDPVHHHLSRISHTEQQRLLEMELVTLDDGPHHDVYPKGAMRRDVLGGIFIPAVFNDEGELEEVYCIVQNGNGKPEALFPRGGREVSAAYFANYTANKYYVPQVPVHNAFHLMELAEEYLGDPLRAVDAMQNGDHPSALSSYDYVKKIAFDHGTFDAKKAYWYIHKLIGGLVDVSTALADEYHALMDEHDALMAKADKKSGKKARHMRDEAQKLAEKADMIEPWGAEEGELMQLYLRTALCEVRDHLKDVLAQQEAAEPSSIAAYWEAHEEAGLRAGMLESPVYGVGVYRVPKTTNLEYTGARPLQPFGVYGAAVAKEALAEQKGDLKGGWCKVIRQDGKIVGVDTSSLGAKFHSRVQQIMADGALDRLELVHQQFKTEQRAMADDAVTMLPEHRLTRIALVPPQHGAVVGE